MSDDDVTQIQQGHFPARLGPCRLLTSVGTGGMGTVYLAEMVEDRPYAPSGTRVAVKLVHPDRLSGIDALERFRREAQLGTTISHSAIVKTHEAGEEQSDEGHHHYIIMEYVEGRTLRELLDDLGHLPEPLLRQVGLRLAEGLAAVHAAGAVHRDIKPENVLITPQQDVKLVDFGVARGTGTGKPSLITTSGVFVGTLRYASPEQILCDTIGPAADLYSLGVMLFEAATASPPFSAEERPALVRLHLHGTPPRAAALSFDISPLLDELIDSLLAKDPKHRLPGAALLAEVLTEGEESAWWKERQDTVSSDARSRRTPLIEVASEAPMVGRDAALGSLKAARLRALGKQGEVVLVTGEAGIGKTRLLAAFANGLDRNRRDTLVLYGSSPAVPSSGEPDALARALVRHFGETGLAEGLEHRLGVDTRLARGFAAFLRGVPGGPDDEAVGGDTLRMLYRQLVLNLLEDHPVVWILDDLHLATPETMGLVHSVAQLCSGRRLLLVVSVREPIEADQSASWDKLGATRVLLPRLEESDVQDLIREILRSDHATARLGPLLSERSDGNPLFLLALVDRLRSMTKIEETSTGSADVRLEAAGIDLPHSVGELQLARLQDLDERERRILDVAAVQGFEFDPELCARVLGEPRLVVLQSLASMERRSQLVRPHGAFYRFDLHSLQEVLVAELPDILTREYHALLADAIVGRDGLEGLSPQELRGNDAAKLARHHLAAANPKAATPLLLPALDWLSANYHAQAVLDLVDQGLQLIASEDASLATDLHLRAAAALDLLGSPDRQRTALESAIVCAERAADPGRLGRAHCELGWFLLWTHDYEAAIAALEASLPAAREAGDGATEARALSTLALVHHQVGDNQTAERLHEEDLKLCTAMGHERGMGRAQLNLGLVSLRLGHALDARQNLESALSHFSLAGWRQGEALCLAFLGNALLHQGELRAAADRQGEALELCKAIGYLHGECHARLGLANCDVELGRFEDAHRQLHQALEATRELGERRLEARALLGKGELARSEGEDALALEHHQAAADLFEQLGHRPELGDALLLLGRQQAQLGRDEDAKDTLQRAHALAEELALPGVKHLSAALSLKLGAALDELATPPSTVSVSRRAELWLLRHEASKDDAHLDEVLALLEQLVKGEDEGVRERFWSGNPTARAARAAAQD